MPLGQKSMIPRVIVNQKSRIRMLMVVHRPYVLIGAQMFHRSDSDHSQMFLKYLHSDFDAFSLSELMVHQIRYAFVCWDQARE